MRALEPALIPATGMPKPVYLTNGFFMTSDASSHLALPEGRQSAIFYHLGQEDLMLALTPSFHLMGLIGYLFSVWFGIPVLLGPDKPLSVDYMVELLRTTRPTAAMCPPSLLEDLSHSDEALACLKDLKSIYFGGASLSPETGERLRKYTQIVTVIGTSEIGWIPSLIPEDPTDWGYFDWNEAYGVDMQDSGDDVFEMVIPRQENARDFKGIFHTYPDINVYPTNDLYTRHPTNPRLWKFYGRKDDVTVLSNGEKFNPVGMEIIIEGHPLVSKAVVVGQSRFQAALLVEPSDKASDMDEKALIEKIWPTVQLANQTIAAHGRVMKNKIGFAVKSKPFKRTPKGTVQRRAVLREYEKEIDAIYAKDLEDDLDPLPETLNKENVTEYIRQLIARVLGKSEIANTEDFYTAGLDSLMTIQVSQTLQKSIQLRQPDVTATTINTQTIYVNPTVDRLSQVVMNILNGEVQADIPREEKIQTLVEKFTSDLPARGAKPQSGLHSPSTVILTGSTGSLGTYLLHTLLNSKGITKVYCLNRSPAESRQKKGFEEKGLHLDANDWTDKVEFLQVSFGEPRFGLSESKYQELLDSVDTIIHNAWKVDFNHSVDSFEDTHIRGVRRFVDFSLSSHYNAHLHFISSISTVGAWTPDMGASVPEVPMEDSAAVLPQGYGESKHIAERICLEASRRSHVPTTVYRVGQIAGPTSTSGQWNPHEWLPTIIATSKTMGKIPNDLGSAAVDWVPVVRTPNKNPRIRTMLYALLTSSTSRATGIIPRLTANHFLTLIHLGYFIQHHSGDSQHTS
jgi:thioester reductase-like protein